MDDLEEMAQRIMLISDGKLAFDGSFADLRKQTGNVCRITLTADSSAHQSELGRLVSSGTGIYEYEVNTAETSMQDVLGKIATLTGVTDIEIRRAPIEQIIAGLYSEWRNGSDCAK